MPAVTRLVAPDVTEIDTLLGGSEGLTAGYLLAGPAPVLVETGSRTSVPAVLEALDALGVGREDLAGIAVTHVHLDHAGGVGDLAAAFPAATVYVHERGARHLADPTRLVASAARVYGPLLDELYGRLEPTEQSRIRVLLDGEAIDVGGGRRVVAIDSPGHAKHHLGFHDSTSGLLFAGDAAGVKLPDGPPLRPATPPPDFDLDLALASLGHFAERRPAAIALAHYGVVPGDALELLGEAEMALRAWADEARRAFADGRDIAEALERRFGEDDAAGAAAGAGGGAGGAAAASAERLAERRRKLDVLNGFHSNAAGFHRWLERGGGAAPGADGNSVRRTD